MQTALRIKPGRLHFEYLPAFAKFILEQKLDEYVREMIRVSRKMDLPLLKFFDGWPIEKMIEVSKVTNVEFLTNLVNNQGAEHIENAMHKWLKDQLPVINRQQIISEDITLISFIRKQIFLKLLPDYTTNIETVVNIVSELDQFFLEQENVSIRTYFDILKNKIEERENLYKQAQALTHLGNWTWEPTKDHFDWSDELYRIYELPLQSKITAEFLRSFTHPDDAEHVSNQMKKAIENNSSFNYHYRIITKSGKQKTLLAIGEMQSDSDENVAMLFGTLQDVTERQTLIEKLQESESLFKHAESLAKTGSWKWEIGSNKIDWSDELYRTYDLEPQSKEITVEIFKSYIHPDDRKYIEDGISQITRHGEQDFTFRIISEKGRQKTLRSLAKVHLNDKGEPVSIIGTEQDITERQQMLEKLQDSEQLYRQAQALAHVGNWRFNISKNEVLWSDELYRIFGLEPQSEQITYESYLAFIHPADRDHVMKTVETAISEKSNYQFQHRIILRDGRIRIVEANGEIVKNEAGDPVYMVGVTYDSTERKLAEQKIKEQEHFIKHIADASPAILYLFDLASNKIVYINHEIKFVLGYSPSEITEMQTGLTELYHPDDLANVLENKKQLYISRGNSFIEYECRVKGSDGEYVWILVREIIFELDSEGNPSQFLGAALDITERKEIENTLSTRNIELQQSNASLEEFAYVASHDLKEPLRKISIFGDRLLGTQYSRLTDDGKLYMDKIIDSSKRMQGLITDLLSVSMISADKSFEMYSLKTILEEVTKMLEYKIEEKRAKIISDDLPSAWIVPSQFRQLFQNLINNSLKFVRPEIPPEIRITHSVVLEKDMQQLNLRTGKRYLRVDFSDNGIGFDNMFANKIFNIFQRLHTKTEYEGTGIGLSICKKVVENHGGVIFAAGNPGSGSTFTIIIPA